MKKQHQIGNSTKVGGEVCKIQILMESTSWFMLIIQVNSKSPPHGVLIIGLIVITPSSPKDLRILIDIYIVLFIVFIFSDGTIEVVHTDVAVTVKE